MDSSYFTIISLVIIAAATGAISLYSLSLQIILATFNFGRGARSRRVALLSLTYALSIFVLWTAAGLGLLYLISVFNTTAYIYILAIASTGAAVAGVLKIMAYVRHSEARSPQITHFLVSLAHRLAIKTKDARGVAKLGALVIGIEFMWTGALYTAVIVMLYMQMASTAPMLIGLYSLVLVVPLVGITVLIVSDVKISAIQRWRDNYARLMQLSMGLLLIALGVYGIALANGALNLE